MALRPDPRRRAVLAMDFQNAILGITPQYRETPLLATVQRVLDTARQTGAGIIYITVSFALG
jgi:nicotinamidase-related amidase